MTAGDVAATVTTVVVLDPADTKPHSDLPGTWREFAEQRNVVWIGGETDPLHRWDAVLADVTGPYAVVAGGPEAEVALTVAERSGRPPAVVLLVDPGADDAAPGSPALAANEAWLRRTTRRREDLISAGTDVRLVAASTGGAQDRVNAPLPLGHPDVVAAVETALGAAPVLTPAAEREPDIDSYDDPEDFADAVGVDPTPEQVDEYREHVEQRPGSA
ncbi:hypothetical protein [Actinokineospora spheciospongiae]|uniref:hypothetical protein n=1 Tax=Actinokineospora spheciospongiae TaxID=909613 RepID=UPI000D8965AF|nr:hypothetical protein [Actinokineospora spheciospongiae]PWW66971.1 hypothetical protein DFQ13_101489 [Actinokineospora spheciospongiae]